MDSNNIIIERQDELKSEVMGAVGAEFAVVDQDSYTRANNYIAGLQKLKKEVIARFAEPKKKADEAHKAVRALERSFLDPINDKIDALRDAIEKWYAAEMRRIAAEEERRRKAAAELADLAADAEAQGDGETAAAAVVAAVMEDATVSVVPKCAGTTMRETWKAVVVDLAQLPREYMIVNQAALDKVAQATKGAVPIPGVRFEKSYINSTRAK